MDDEWVMDSGWTGGKCSHCFVRSFLGTGQGAGRSPGGSRAEAPPPRF